MANFENLRIYVTFRVVNNLESFGSTLLFLFESHDGADSCRSDNFIGQGRTWVLLIIDAIHQ
jgi:hypothetical protein